MTSPEVTLSDAGRLPPPRHKLLLAFGSVTMSAALLALCLLIVDARQVGERLARAEPRWFVAFFLVYVLQVALLGRGVRCQLDADDVVVAVEVSRAVA